MDELSEVDEALLAMGRAKLAELPVDEALEMIRREREVTQFMPPLGAMPRPEMLDRFEAAVRSRLQ